MKKFLLSIIHFIFYVLNKYVFIKNRVEYTEFPKINGLVFIRNKGKVVFGKGVKINSSRTANPVSGNTKTVFVTRENGTIKIGNNVGISNAIIFSTNKVIIEDFVLIGAGTKIYDTDFHSIIFEERIQVHDPGIKNCPVTIKQGAFIGADCIILKGVTIGEKSIVGAGSVVTKNIPPYEVWAGNPAKFIKRLNK